MEALLKLNSLKSLLSFPLESTPEFYISQHPLCFLTNKGSEKTKEKLISLWKSNKYPYKYRAFSLWMYQWSLKTPLKLTNIAYHITHAASEIIKSKTLKNFLWLNNNVNVTCNFWTGIHLTIYPPNQLTMKALSLRKNNVPVKDLKVILPFNICSNDVKILVRQRFAPQEDATLRETIKGLQEEKVGQQLLLQIEKHKNQLKKEAQKIYERRALLRVIIDLLGMSLELNNFALYTPEILGKLFPNENARIGKQGGHTLIGWKLPQSIELDKIIQQIKDTFPDQLKHPRYLKYFNDIYEIYRNYYFKHTIPLEYTFLTFQYNGIITLTKLFREISNITKQEEQSYLEIIQRTDSQILLQEYLKHPKVTNTYEYAISLEPNAANDGFIMLYQDDIPLKVEDKGKQLTIKTFTAL